MRLVCNGSAWRSRLFLWLSLGFFVRAQSHERFTGFSSFVVPLGCRRSGKLQSFFSDAIAPNTFLRKLPLTTNREQLCQAKHLADAIYLVRIPHRMGHSIHSNVRPGFHPCRRKAPHPRTDSSWPQREGSQVAPGQLRPNNRAEPYCLWSPLCLTAKIPVTGAEGRALLRSNLSAVPGANSEWGGTRPPSAIRDWHQASNRLTCVPPQRLRVYTLYALLFLLLFRSGLRDNPALGVGLPLAQHVPEDRG